MNHVKKARSIYSNIIRCMIVILYLHSYHDIQSDLLCQECHSICLFLAAAKHVFVVFHV